MTLSARASRHDAPPSKRVRVVQGDASDDDDIQGAEYWARQAAAAAAKAVPQRRDLYLDTIQRNVLDFDFEKVCSVSMSNVHVYACLVCGKYFQGRGKTTHAYFHAIDESHHVFMNLDTTKVYILPDNYEVTDPSFSDIQYQLRLTYSEAQLRTFDTAEAPVSRDLRAHTYLPGFVGINNLGHSEGLSVVLHALAHVTPLRNYFLRGGTPATHRVDATEEPLLQSTSLVQRFGLLLRRLWNPRAFKSQVSPQEFLQEVAQVSHGSFQPGTPADPVEFLGWLLNRLHMDLVGGTSHRKQPSVITTCFQGALRLESQNVIVRTGLEDESASSLDRLDHDGRRDSGQQDEHGHAKFNIEKAIQVSQTPFLMLTIDLPPLPVFQDVVAENIIPQVPLVHVLAKYDGITIQEAQGRIRRHHLTRLPPYLILHFRRFTKNRFVDERNTTIVNFPTVGLDMSPYVASATKSDEDADHVPLQHTYNLLANITHEAAAGTVREGSTWNAQVHTRTEPEAWYQMHDLLVEQVNKQMLFLGESYVQIWERIGAIDAVEAQVASLPPARPRSASKKKSS